MPRVFALQLVDGLVELIFRRIRGPARGVCRPGSAFRVLARPSLSVKIVPGAAAAEADDEISGGELEGAKGIDEQCNQFGIGGGMGLAEDVGVELEVFAQPALLLAFVAKELRDGEPFDRLFVVARVSRNHAGESGGHFRAQCHGALALVRELVELSDDFTAALGRVQLERFERGAVVFAEAVAARYVPPIFKDVIAGIRAPHVLVRERLRIKIAETRQTFHAGI